MVGQTLGPYGIKDKLGAGGMGDFCLAEDTTLDRQVALKVRPPELGVSRRGYNAWRRRPATHWVREDRRLEREILTIHPETEGQYGTARVERSLRRQGSARM